MSELNKQLNEMLSRMKELENAPSNLVKDQALDDIRRLYDLVRSSEVNSLPSPVVEEPEPVNLEAPVKETQGKKEVADEASEPDLNSEATISELHEQVEQETETAKPLIDQQDKEETESDQDEGILAGMLNKTPLADLSTAIPLNEKFGMIRNLFNGNASDFADAILKLNNAKSAEEMRHYFELLGKRLGWTEETETYKGFWGYVDRRMMTASKSNANTD